MRFVFVCGHHGQFWWPASWPTMEQHCYRLTDWKHRRCSTLPFECFSKFEIQADSLHLDHCNFSTWDSSESPSNSGIGILVPRWRRSHRHKTWISSKVSNFAKNIIKYAWMHSQRQSTRLLNREMCGCIWNSSVYGASFNFAEESFRLI